MLKHLCLCLPLLIILTACGESQSATSSGPGGVMPTPTPHFKVGETANVGSTWQITIQSVSTSKGSEVLIPSDAGDVFVLINVALNNTSKQEQELYGGLWTLRGPDGTAYSTIMSSEPPSGKIEAGTPAKGTLGYEAPGSVKAFRLAFDNSTWASGQTIWDITVS